MVGINQVHQTYIKYGFKKSITVHFAEKENKICERLSLSTYEIIVLQFNLNAVAHL